MVSSFTTSGGNIPGLPQGVLNPMNKALPGTPTFFLFIFCCTTATLAQSSPPTETCGIQHQQQLINQQSHSGFRPILAGDFADPSLESDLQRDYHAIYFQPPSPETETTLHVTLTLAISRKNRCAEALATYALGLAALQNNIAAASTFFHQAEAAFDEVHSATGLAHTHFEFAALARNVKPQAEITATFNSVAAELDAAGDPTDALTARLQGVNPSAPDASAQFEHLTTEAQTLHATHLEASAHQIWGDSFFNRGQYDQAMLHYQKSDALYTTCLCNPDQRAYLQTSMGRLERVQGRPESAIPHYRLALHLQTLSHDQAYVPQTLNAISVAYESMRQYQKAIAYLQQALAVAHAIHSQPFIDFLEANLGYLYYQAGQPRRGLPLLQHAASNFTNDYQRCSRYDQLSEIYRTLGQLGDAESSITSAIEACERNKNNRDLADSLETRARIRMLRGELDAALADAQHALSITEEISSHLVPEDAHKRGYNEQTINIYATTISILTRMGRYPEALEVTEQSRSRAFLDLLSSPHATLPIIATSTRLSLIKAPTQLSSSRGNSSPASPSSTDLLLQSESHVPSMQTPEIIATAERLHSTILAYWLSKDSLSIWVIRPNSPVYGITQPIKPAHLEALVRATNPYSADTTRGLRTRGTHTLSLAPVPASTELNPWRSLYQILIAPIASHLPQEAGSLLTIIPHGPLFQLPFAALIDSHNHYLIEHYALHTVPAAGLLLYTEKNETAASQLTPHFVFVANPQHLPQIPNSTPLPPLPGSAAEVEAIAHSLPSTQVTLLEGSQASTTNLEAAIPTATVLHFATHAIVSGTDPFGSFLALNQSLSSGNDDGLLTTSSIYALHLHTQMVVLSACRTGLGPVSTDGVAGLSRAFFYAGSASVLTTLWDVADQPTATLMPLFYQGLNQGQSRATALRTAQLALISDLRHNRIKVSFAGTQTPLSEKPAFWAAFSLSGQP
ncbi:CHAT domain-containing protein [Edaphobacter aggregans]|uniref:CHAT domain-containing protein n=2 Tax=Edaphobacter aggregans TaxID=570835 RepID=A0A428MML1_9BACT|nr:CHAT domain-containing protein [Edaphobacter aggregans]